MPPRAARALVRLAFTGLGVREVVATTMAVNAGSRRVMEKAGWRLARGSSAIGCRGRRQFDRVRGRRQIN